MRYIFDIETNGLLPELTTIHCLVMKDVEGRAYHSAGPDQIEKALAILGEAGEIIGHNILGFDIPAIQKLYPDWKPKGLVTDTLVMSRLIFPDLRDRDFNFRRTNPDFPVRSIGSHGLKAWGYRLTNHKDEYEGGWESWSPEMQKYCEQDVEVTASLWNRLLSKNPSPGSIALEHDVFKIIQRQEQYGFRFDCNGARSFYAGLLSRDVELRAELARAFPAWEVVTPFTPKRANKTRGYEAGVTIHKRRQVDFNPSSRDHVAEKLTEKYGWEPAKFTPEGKPAIDEEVLASLPYPEGKLLEEHFVLQKVMGMLGEGRNAWLKLEKAGRIHGRVNTNGAVTGRMTHSHPNMAQVPSSRSPYGKECRSLFIAGPGCLLVGCDADALELRCLAGYMANYDDGKYINTVLKGNKDDATDMHSINAGVLGCDRDTAKTWFYAFIYGAGNAKLGSILGASPQRGGASRKRFLASLPALAKLIGNVQVRAAQRGHLLGLDGRHLAVRSEHAALNTLLQSAGAIFMKTALVILDIKLCERGYKPGIDFEFVANVHDEWQIEVREELADVVGKIAVQSIRDAGAYYKFKCPLDGNYAIGKTWADTH